MLDVTQDRKSGSGSVVKSKLTLGSHRRPLEVHMKNEALKLTDRL